MLEEVQESCAASSSQHSESSLHVQREIGQCQEADILIALWSTGKKSLSQGSSGSKDVFLEYADGNKEQFGVMHSGSPVTSINTIPVFLQHQSAEF